MISTAEIRATSTYFRDSIRTGLNYFEESDDDMMNHHILDCIGALIYTQNIEKYKRKVRRKNEDCITASKRRVFWQTVQQIAAVQLAGGANAALSSVLDVFPIASSNQTDDRSWMLLHWAVSLPNTDIQDIETLITAQPEAVSTLTRSSGYNTVHLACMANARVEMLHLLQAHHFPLWGESVTPCNRFTPLHLAVKYSSSPALVRKLARLYPPALEMKDRHGVVPLYVIQTKSIEGPQILQALLDAAPHTARAFDKWNSLPLHYMLNRYGYDDYHVVSEMATILLAAYPAAVDIRDNIGWLPIHYAAAVAPLPVLQMIAEVNNMANLTGWR